MLQAPTGASKKLLHLFNYQLTVLNTVRIADESAEAENNEVCFFVARFCAARLQSLQSGVFAVEWVQTSDPARAADLICVYWGPKYSVPGSAGVHGKRSRSSKSMKDAVSGKRVLVERPQLAPAAATEVVVGVPIPTGASGLHAHLLLTYSLADISLGAFYDPRLLPDYGGPIFRHKSARLVQRDIRNMNGDLIPPWKTYEELRPGTLVLMKVSFYCLGPGDIGGNRKV
jgi:hypothetical protein